MPRSFSPIMLLLVCALLLPLVPISKARAQLTNAPAPVSKTAVKVETFAKGLVHPWGMQFLPTAEPYGGRLLVTERDGRVRLIGRDGSLSPPVDGVPKVAATGQGGLLDVALDPKFATNGLVYLSYAEPRDGNLNGASVARGRLVLDGGPARLADVKVIFQQLPAASGGLHFGSRLVFADDGMLFVTLGERYQKDHAQDLRRHFGKVVRIAPDGSIPEDNPRFGPTAAKGIWSFGHRNPQSAAIHPVTRKLWLVEHGPKGGDEVNVPEKGRNYGWPVIGYGIDYSGATIHEGTHKEGMEQPVYYWRPSIAPSGMAFYTGDVFPAWKGNLFVGALAGQHLSRLVLDGEKIVGEEKLLAGLGERIRDVRMGPDGHLWLLTDHPQGRVLRLVPGP
jgi:aldose sugar dehydrogenase